MIATRRAVLRGIAAAMATPAVAIGTDADAAAWRALDEAATLPPDRALAALASLTDAGLGVGRRLDLAAARAGLMDDRALLDPTLPPDVRFAWQVRRITGSDVTLTTLSRDLEAAQRALTAAATPLFDRLGISGATIGARFERMWRDPRWRFADDASGREQAVDAMRATLATIRPRLRGLIGSLPPAFLDVGVRALDAAEVAANKSGYRTLPAPGVRGGYVVDLADITRRPRFTLPSVVAHELLPGHMAQMPMEALAHPHPLRLRYAAAFSEGWGIYAERLMATDGLFASPQDRLGHIHWMLFRIGRGRADVAIHVHGQSPDQAQAAMRETMGESAYFAPFATDIARIVAAPAIRAGEAWLPLYLTQARPRDRARWPAYHMALLRWGRIRTEQIAAAVHAERSLSGG
ncbi:DUF885 family protein [uncultured Sphingomonas sp.]|uniref:DUF885 family protein n=1 Tax=uncultured Sphingomonas sp. TaxID=158754 RepID=UPI003747A0C9